jgi:hypothetical protein
VVSLWTSNLGNSICFSDHLRYLVCLSEIIDGDKKTILNALWWLFLEKEKMLEKAPYKQRFIKRLMSKVNN